MVGPAPCLIITGPTAVGKTASLVSLQKKLKKPIEVISADAFQVYRGLDIGTAKPDQDLRAQIPHHLIDLIDINQQFSVADFCSLANQLIEEIIGREAVPVMCGGTVFYIKHFVYGMPQSPPSDPQIRQALEAELQLVGLPNMYRLLQECDPQAAQKIAPNDWYRISRAIEVWRTSGLPLSSFKMQAPQPIRPVLCLGLERPRDQLLRMIETRVDQMISSGLATELEELLRQGFSTDDPGFKAIGYHEFVEIAAQRKLPPNALDLNEVADLIKIHTRQYAKRQMTFLRGLPLLQWLPATEPEANASRIVELLGERLPSLLT